MKHASAPSIASLPLLALLALPAGAHADEVPVPAGVTTDPCVGVPDGRGADQP